MVIPEPSQQAREVFDVPGQPVDDPLDPYCWDGALDMLMSDPFSQAGDRRACKTVTRWQQYVRTLDIPQLRGLSFLWLSVLLRVLKENWCDRNRDRDDRHSALSPQSFRMVDWSAWRLFIAGPQVFWRCWCTREVESLSQWLHDQCENTNRMLAFVQAEASREV